MNESNVFISYSHDTEEHVQRVLQLATALSRHGIHIELDQYHTRPSRGWPRWCEEQLRPENTRFVLVICTDTYRQRVEGRMPANEGHGVFWEGGIIYNYLYNDNGNERFIPILFPGATDKDIPHPLRGHTRYKLKVFDFTDADYLALFRELTAQPAVTKPTPGPLVVIPSGAPPPVNVSDPWLPRHVKSTFPTLDHWEILNRTSAVIGTVTFVIANFVYAVDLLSRPKHSGDMITGYERVLTALVLGGAAAVAYGLLWSTANRIFGWHYGDGGSTPTLPKGWAAVVLSLSTTLPLALLPPLYEFFSKREILLPLHYDASVIMIISAAFGHLLLYGTEKPRVYGFRDRVFPVNSPLSLFRAIEMEVIYTAVHFASTVLVYQLAVHVDHLSYQVIFEAIRNTLISSFIFFFGASSYIMSRYPSSLVAVPVEQADGSLYMDDRWVTARGIVNGAILMVAFMIGILL
jgi:hypothetical protein